MSLTNINAIVMSKEDYNNLMETIYLNNILGMKSKLLEGKNEKLEEGEAFEW